MKILAIVLMSVFFLALCDSGNEQQQQQTAVNVPAQHDPAATDEYWAKDNFDLQRTGDLLERAETPEEFEWFLNEPGNVNNLDLNGDGNVDYISVREFDDRDDNTRGLSLFTQFGPGLVQEIATALFYRDAPSYPGSRMLLTGNDNIFGDNSFYESNALDRPLDLVSNLFRRDTPYSSPYYFGNYPSGYNAFPVVERPLYVARMTELYPKPAFAYAAAAPAFFQKVKIKSPNNGLHLGQIKARLAKPTKEQAEFYKNNPMRRQFAKYSDKPGRPNPPRSERGDERGNPTKDERGAQRGNPDKPSGPKSDVKGSKPDHSGKGQGGNPDKGGGKKP